MVFCAHGKMYHASKASHMSGRATVVLGALLSVQALENILLVQRWWCWNSPGSMIESFSTQGMSAYVSMQEYLKAWVKLFMFGHWSIPCSTSLAPPAGDKSHMLLGHGNYMYILSKWLASKVFPCENICCHLQRRWKQKNLFSPNCKLRCDLHKMGKSSTYGLRKVQCFSHTIPPGIFCIS